MIPSTLKQESVREHSIFNKQGLEPLLRQIENITNKDVLQIEKDIEINIHLPNRISLNIVVK